MITLDQKLTQITEKIESLIRLYEGETPPGDNEESNSTSQVIGHLGYINTNLPFFVAKLDAYRTEYAQAQVFSTFDANVEDKLKRVLDPQAYETAFIGYMKTLEAALPRIGVGAKESVAGLVIALSPDTGFRGTLDKLYKALEVHYGILTGTDSDAEVEIGGDLIDSLVIAGGGSKNQNGGSVIIGGDVKRSTIITGDHNDVRYNG